MDLDKKKRIGKRNIKTLLDMQHNYFKEKKRRYRESHQEVNNAMTEVVAVFESLSPQKQHDLLQQLNERYVEQQEGAAR